MHLWDEQVSLAVPRFTVFVVDLVGEQAGPAAAGLRTMAVFMVPMGCEADYRFNTKDGLTDIGEQAKCKVKRGGLKLKAHRIFLHLRSSITHNP